GPGGVFTYKDVGGRRPDFKKNTGTFVAGAGVEDLEHGVVDGISDDPWQCDTSSGQWYWMPSAAYLSPTRIIQTLADVVSKNGNLLLNYTQRPDGSLDEETEWIATEVGKWLDTNGEAIFGTRPWKVAAEGANTFGSGEMSLLRDATFDASDVRYTAKGDTRFAIALGKPSASDGGWCFKSLRGEQVDRVTLLGHGDALAWSLNDDGLAVQRPDGLRGGHAWCFKIE
ncbi:MAG: alpha-L-fucosidase, partial [Planctomycetota bacterium]